MTDAKTIQTRTRLSQEDKLAAMLAHQADLQAQVKAQQKKVAQRAVQARAALVTSLGEVALEVLGNTSPEALRALLAGRVAVAAAGAPGMAEGY